MNEGEQRFYLREVYSHWSTPRISGEKIAELELAKLIERSFNPALVIRLTNEGAQQKMAARERKFNSTLNLVQTPERPARRARKSRPAPLRQKLS